MNKLICIALLCSFGLTTISQHTQSTAAVSLAGGVIAAKNSVDNKKYKRKDCPVCKGKGWYISGDDISKVPCGYCEPESADESTVEHEPIIIYGPNHNKKTIIHRR